MFQKIPSWIKIFFIIVFSLGMLGWGFPLLFIGSFYLIASSKGYIFWLIVLGLFLLCIGYLYPERKKYQTTITCLSMISVIFFIVSTIFFLYYCQALNAPAVNLTQTEELNIGFASIFLTGAAFFGVALCALVAFLFWWGDRQKAINDSVSKSITSKPEVLSGNGDKSAVLPAVPEEKPSVIFNYVSAIVVYMVLTYITGFIGTRILLGTLMIENLPPLVQVIETILIILLFCFISGYCSLYIYRMSNVPLTKKSHFIICSVLYFFSFIAVLGMFQGKDIILAIPNMLHILMNYLALYYLQYKISIKEEAPKVL